MKWIYEVPNTRNMKWIYGVPNTRNIEWIYRVPNTQNMKRIYPNTQNVSRINIGCVTRNGLHKLSYLAKMGVMRGPKYPK